MTATEHWSSLARHSPLGVVADLDGTLIPFAPTPAEARVPPEVLELLERIAALPNLRLAVVSGRLREQLDAMVGHVKGLHLAAEHGAWLRRGGAWEMTAIGDPAEFTPIADELEAIAATFLGALVERKTGSVCLHLRRVPPHLKDAALVQAMAAMQAWRARHAGHEIIEGVETVELRSVRARKSVAIPWLRQGLGADARLLALGDDVTDEDMFDALGPADDAVLVGPRPRRRSAARWRLESPAHCVEFLQWIVTTRRGAKLPGPPRLPAPFMTRPPLRDAAATTFGLIALSNRLPNLRTPVGNDEARRKNVGGLVSALAPALARRGGLWLGWSGRTIPGEAAGPAAIIEDVAPPLASLDLPETLHHHYYNGLCNRGLWPLFHTVPSRASFRDADWDAYVRVNRNFALAAAELVPADAMVWVHDYHLLLLAAALRQLGHRGPIGLFLHIPFPAHDVFSMFPWADRLLADLLAFDLLGFHTPGYVANLRECVGAIPAARVSDDAVEFRGRRTRIAAFPIGIVPEDFESTPDPSTAEEVESILKSIAPTRLILGVDRLDYTKGIPERLLAFARLLETQPEWRGKVSLVQVSVPSRADVPEYADQRAAIEAIVGRINGEYGEPSWTPVRYVYRSYERPQLVALYRAAAVGYVTPLRDGMNLVAKEFVAAQEAADPGVLLLSQFAGAAVELKDALLTNPFHTDGMARDLDQALRMTKQERVERHTKLSSAVRRTTALTWAEEFLNTLAACR